MISLWKGNNVSFGGRLVLINVVLNSIPLIFFSFYRVPKIVLDEVINIQRPFLGKARSINARIIGFHG